MKVQSGADIGCGTLGIVFSTNCDDMRHFPLKYTWYMHMVAAVTAQCNGRGAWTMKQYQNQLRKVVRWGW